MKFPCSSLLHSLVDKALDSGLNGPGSNPPSGKEYFFYFLCMFCMKFMFLRTICFNPIALIVTGLQGHCPLVQKSLPVPRLPMGVMLLIGCDHSSYTASSSHHILSLRRLLVCQHSLLHVLFANIWLSSNEVEKQKKHRSKRPFIYDVSRGQERKCFLKADKGMFSLTTLRRTSYMNVPQPSANLQNIKFTAKLMLLPFCSDCNDLLGRGGGQPIQCYFLFSQKRCPRHHLRSRPRTQSMHLLLQHPDAKTDLVKGCVIKS